MVQLPDPVEVTLLIDLLEEEFLKCKDTLKM